MDNIDIISRISSYKTVAIVQLIASIVLLAFVVWSKLLPPKYVLAIAAVVVLLFALFFFWIRTKKNKTYTKGALISKGFGKILSLLLSIGMILGSCYGYMGVDKLKSLFTKEVIEYNHYAVYVLNNSEIKTVDDLKGLTIEMSSVYDEGLNDVALKKMEEAGIDVSIVLVDDYDLLASDLYDDRIKAILVDTTYDTMLVTNHETFEDDVREVWGVDIDIKEAGTGQSNYTYVPRELLITEEAFNIYISGMDSYGKVAGKSRTDVNLVLTVNPVTKEILMTSIPRDYYVKLADKNGSDKLTHSGLGGVAASAQTVANLLGVDIDYYFKVGFSSLVGIVDALGGVTVYSPQAFTTLHGNYYIKQGDNFMDGAKALGFVRERYAFARGDNERVKNTQRLLTAIIKKAASPAILTNYTQILKAVNGLFITNMSSDDIFLLVQMQLNDMAEWHFSSQACVGSGKMMTGGYYMPKNNLYYMIPKEESVQKAHENILTIMNGGTITEE